VERSGLVLGLRGLARKEWVLSGLAFSTSLRLFGEKFLSFALNRRGRAV
jgi:hypothetical protein